MKDGLLMNVCMISRYGKGPVEFRKVPIPTVGDNDVLVSIHAASVNPIDFKIKDGRFRMFLKFKLPVIMGNDFSGTVVEVGRNVVKFKVGDNVYGRPDKDRIGTFAEYIAIDVSEIASMPSNLSFEQAASIPLVGLTDYQALHDVLRLKPKEKILIHAGAGGIGTFAIQLAKQMGAYVATTASQKGFELVKRLGADEIVDYRNEKFEDRLHDYDAVFDTLGGKILLRSFKVLRKGGRIVSIAGLPNRRFGIEHGYGFIKRNLLGILAARISFHEARHKAKYSFLLMKPSGKQLGVIADLIERGSIVPVIDRVYPFGRVQEALDYQESGRVKGKIVLKIR